MAFCDFCTCVNCTNGAGGIYHAETTDGRWICDVCWEFDQCTSDNNSFGVPRGDHPCKDPECAHRPKLRVAAGKDRWIEGTGEMWLVSLADALAAEDTVRED